MNATVWASGPQIQVRLACPAATGWSVRAQVWSNGSLAGESSRCHRDSVHNHRGGDNNQQQEESETHDVLFQVMIATNSRTEPTG